MLLLLSGVAVLLTCGNAASPLQRQQVTDRLALAKENPVAEFKSWVMEHGKAYVADEEEYARRYAVWRKNLDYVIEYNSKHNTHWLGLNVHADLTNEEFKAHRLGFDYEAAKKAPRKVAPLQATGTLEDIPDTMDWRDHGAVTKVKNQQQCGSCWAFSTTGAIEGINAIFTSELISLSEQELIDCDVAIDHGCHGGLMDHAFAWVIENGGIDTEDDYKYTAKDGKCKVKRENRHVVTIDDYMDVPTKNPKELLKAVARQPIAIAIQANQLSFQLYNGGVLTEHCGTDLDHGVLIAGYGTENGTDYWLVKNSWGAKWGDEGYIKIARNMTDGAPGQCGVTMLPSFPTKTHPNPPRPPPIPPDPPMPPPAPPPPTPPPVKCDDYVSCPGGSTCCCLLEYSGQCFQWACCPLVNAVCCSDHIHCCPSNLPTCDVAHGRCLKDGARPGASNEDTWWDSSASVPWVTKVPAFVQTVDGMQQSLQQE